MSIRKIAIDKYQIGFFDENNQRHREIVKGTKSFAKEVLAKRESEVLFNTIVTAVINILLNFIFIPIMSYDGTSLSTVLSEFIVMIMNGYSCRDIIKPIIFKKETLKNLLESIIGCIGIVIVCLLCQWGWNSMIWKTIFSVVLSILMYGAILVLLGNEIIISMLKNTINFIRDKI